MSTHVFTPRFNTRHKQVAILQATGMSQTDAYVEVYHCDRETAKTESSSLNRTNPLFKAYLDSLIKRKEELALSATVSQIMSAHEVKARLSDFARANLVDFLDTDGNPRLTRDTPHHAAAQKLVRRKRRDADGNTTETSEISLIDQIEALRELAKIHGLYAPARHQVQSVRFHVEVKALPVDTAPDALQRNSDGLYALGNSLPCLLCAIIVLMAFSSHSQSLI